MVTARKGNRELCTTRSILEVVARKWSVCVINALHQRDMRFNELKRHLDSVSTKALSDTLKLLEEKMLIERRILPGNPPGVLYSLTPMGSELAEALQPLVRWVAKWDERHNYETSLNQTSR